MDGLGDIKGFVERLSVQLSLLIEMGEISEAPETDGAETGENLRRMLELYQQVSGRMLKQLDGLQLLETEEEGIDDETWIWLYQVMFAMAEMEEEEVAALQTFKSQVCWFRQGERVLGVILEATSIELYGIHVAYFDHDQDSCQVLCYFLFGGDWWYGPSGEPVPEDVEIPEGEEPFGVLEINTEQAFGRLDDMIGALLTTTDASG